MITYIRKWFRDPVFLLALAAGLIAFAVQSGELGTSDTTHRLQATHALWTSETPVLLTSIPTLVARPRWQVAELVWHWTIAADAAGGCGGNLCGAASGFRRVPRKRSNGAQHYCQLQHEYFPVRADRSGLLPISEAIEVRGETGSGGVMALLLATTHLHYTQNLMEKITFSC